MFVQKVDFYDRRCELYYICQPQNNQNRRQDNDFRLILSQAMKKYWRPF